MGSRFGLWGRFPLVMGGRKPRAQAMYETMLTSRGDGRYSKDVDADVNVDLQAYAHVLDGAARAQERGMLNGFPGYATDFLPTWETALGRFPDESETEGERRAMLDAILAGNGDPNRANILAALALALPTESIALIVATARKMTFGAPVAITNPPAKLALFGGGGELVKGDYYVSFAFEKADGTIVPTSNPISLTNATSLSLSLLVGEVPLSTVAGAEKVHVYLSAAPNSLLRAWVATTRGEAVLISRLPQPPETLPLYHIGILLSKSGWDDAVVRGKIDQILGPMLSAWTTYDFIISTPFILGTSVAAGASELGRGGL